MAAARSPGPSRPRRRVLRAASLLGLVALAACGIRREGDPGTARLFENRVWVDTGAGAAPGSYRAFLSDGTLIMDSCVETYRLVTAYPASTRPRATACASS